jgi:hypothetical protein
MHCRVLRLFMLPNPSTWAVFCSHHLTLSLALVTVDAGGRQVLAQQVVLQLVSTTLGLNKHKGQTLQDNRHSTGGNQVTTTIGAASQGAQVASPTQPAAG